MQKHQLSIDFLLSSIPSKYYLALDEDHESMLSNKYMKNKKQPAEIKGLAKQAKKLKFDPTAQAPEAEEEAVAAIVPMQAVSITDLRVKLQQKIASLRRGRGADNTAKPKQDLLEKRLGKKKAAVVARATGNTKKRKMDESEVVVDTVEPKKPKTVVEDVSFGVLSFGGEKKKIGLDTMSKLKKVESQQAKLEKIKEKNPEKAIHIQEAQKWDKLMNLAEGNKVMDDPKLLKKTLKKQEKQKEKSGKTWVDRKETVRKNEEDGQKRRNDNILARKEGRPTKRVTSKRPGFEGGRAKKADKADKGKKNKK